MSLIDELKRRNVFRVGIAYAVVAWLIAQVAALALESFEAPGWIIKTVLLLLVMGFPLALILAWALEVTPEGIRRESAIDSARPGNQRIGRKFDFFIMGVMAVGILFLILDNYVLEQSPSNTPDGTVGNSLSSNRKVMLAVLPFDNLSDDPEQEYFSDGLTEELITQLGRMQRDRLGVIGRTSAMYYKNKNIPVAEIGGDLDVEYVLEGSVRRSGGRVRITVRLTQVSDQTQLWAHNFEDELDDIFGVQNEIARQVSSTFVGALLQHEGKRRPEARPANVAAYDSFLKARYHESRGGQDGYVQAIEYYKEATQKDSDYALAYAALGHAYGMLAYGNFMPHVEGRQKMWDYTQQAADIDPNLTEVEVNFADDRYFYAWDWVAGEAGYRRAFELDPSSESIVWHYALCLHSLGRFADAIELLERGLRTDPRSVLLRRALVDLYLDSGQPEIATEQYRKMIESYPREARFQAGLGDAYLAAGQNREAVAAYLEERRLAGEEPIHVQALSNAFDTDGIYGFWRERAQQLSGDENSASAMTKARVYARLPADDQILDFAQAIKDAALAEELPSIERAEIHVLLGIETQAVEWLEKAYAEQDPQLAWVKVDRRWDAIRQEVRFQELLRRMDFPD